MRAKQRSIDWKDFVSENAIYILVASQIGSQIEKLCERYDAPLYLETESRAGQYTILVYLPTLNTFD
jgi:hypothetical protein